MEEFVGAYCDLVRQIFIAGPPVVAALPGHAIAGGLIVAMAADERIAAEGKAKFGLSEVILGVSVPQCLMEPFRHVLGARQMERLAVTGENRTVEEALAIGLLDAVVPAAELGERAFERARVLGRPLEPGPRRDQAALAGGGPGAFRPGARSRPLPRLLVLGGRALPDPRHGGQALEPGVIPADEILEALDLSRAQPGSGFLEAIFLRFNDRVPFENASKIVRDAEVAEEPAKPRTPDVFWADHLERGTGGTCFARVAAFDALLTELGFRTRRVVGQVRNPNDHAALFVETPRGETIADVGFPLPALLPAAPGLVESALAGLRIEAIRSGEGFRVTFEGGVPEGPRTLAIGTATASPEAYRELWRQTFRKGAPFLQEVSLRRDLGQRVLSFARGEVRVDDRHSRLRIPLPAPRASALSVLFGVDEALLARALAIAGDPKPASAETRAHVVPRHERLAGCGLRRDRVAGRVPATLPGRRRCRRSRSDVLGIPAAR